MTIVAATDTRNSQWAQSDSFGKKMLQKMGWKGDGLGKNQQGTSQNLRAVRRAESLGIGAQNDSFGEAGWAETSRGFHGVLAKLKAEHGGGSDGDDSKEARKKRRKEEKKRKKREEKRRAKEAASREGSSGSSDDGIRLPQNKVLAGHARKWRQAKDLKSKSAEDMAAIFGVKADIYKQPRDWVQKSETSVAKDEDNDEKNKIEMSSSQEDGEEKDSKETKKKKRKSDDKSKKEKKKKKRKRDD